MSGNRLDEAREAESWWRRPAGGREVLTVALPLVVSSVSWTVMTFIDRILLNHVSGEAMSAAFSAGAVWFAVLCLPLGICTYVGTFVAQYFGHGRFDRIGPSMWQGVWVALVFSPLVLLCVLVAQPLFSMARHSASLTALEVSYFQILCAGGPALLLAQAFSSFYSGRGQTWVVMVIDGAGAILNLLLDIAWIFGYAGFPAWGIEGAAWATVVSMWVKVAVYLVLVLQRQHAATFNTWGGMRLDRALLERLLWFGGPSGIQMLLDVAGFTVFILLVGRIGVLEAEATSMTFSISTLAFMPIWGFGLAASILVGQHLGENRDDLASRATWTSLAISASYMGAISLLFVAAPGMFLEPFFAGQNPEEVAATKLLATHLLRFVAAYNLFDALMMIFVSAIKGAGDTRFVLWVSLVMAVAFGTMSWLAIEVFHFNIYGCWALITAWVWVLGVVYLLRFLQGKWRSMRVIEPDVVGAAKCEEPLASATASA